MASELTRELDMEKIENIMQCLANTCEEVDEMSERLNNAVEMINRTFGEVENIIDDVTR